jgi:hypothetical protein
LAEEEGKSRAERGALWLGRICKEEQGRTTSTHQQERRLYRGRTTARKRANSGHTTSAEEGRKSEAVLPLKPIKPLFAGFPHTGVSRVFLVLSILCAWFLCMLLLFISG